MVAMPVDYSADGAIFEGVPGYRRIVLLAEGCSNPLANAADQPCRFGGGQRGAAGRLRTEDLTRAQEKTGDAFFFSQAEEELTGGTTARRGTGDDWALATTCQHRHWTNCTPPISKSCTHVVVWG